MSDLLIRGMEMPKDGFITITVTSDGRVVGNSKKENGKFEYLDNEDIAKAVPVPEHGRLIDADELKKVIANAKHMDANIYDGKTMYSDHLCVGADYDDVCAAIDETATIITAEEATKV